MSALRLAPDPLFPRRDLLLDADALRARLAVLLGEEVESCSRIRASYHPGRSLRVLFEVRGGDTASRVAARMFAPGTSGSRFGRARAAAGGGVVHDPELSTVFTVFPYDRKLRALPHLVDGEWPAVPGFPHARFRLVAHAPERAATVAAVDPHGHAVAFVKLYAEGGAARTVRIHELLAERPLRVPAVLARWPALGAAAFEAIEGAPPEDAEAARAAGGALASLHSIDPLDGRRLVRFDLDTLDRAAATIAALRPDAGDAALSLARALRRRAPSGREPMVCVHGDVHPKNVLVSGTAASLIDLDDVAAGPAAGDLGSVLAGMRYRAVAGDGRAFDGEAVCDGYRSVLPLPQRSVLHWHTAAALLGERALRAITRLRTPGLARLDAVLAAGLEEVA
jgi:aminoglycoside phosphotransferase (APT) family kinase protein